MEINGNTLRNILQNLAAAQLRGGSVFNKCYSKFSMECGRERILKIG